MRHGSHQPKLALDGAKVELLLFLNGISKREIARRSGVDHMVVVRTVANRPGVGRDKRLSVARALAEHFGMPVELLLASSPEVKQPGEEMHERGNGNEDGEIQG
jgi:transcriptional regulator with XRE-family HTH domain